jgi:hypothetical protein
MKWQGRKERRRERQGGRLTLYLMYSLATGCMSSYDITGRLCWRLKSLWEWWRGGGERNREGKRERRRERVRGRERVRERKMEREKERERGRERERKKESECVC